jgi:hypothetical protein
MLKFGLARSSLTMKCKSTPVTIQIEDAIKPSGTDFASLLQLRDAVREVVLAHCGEPDLGELV